MGKVARPHGFKFFVGFISNDIGLMRRISQILERKFGRSDLESGLFSFDFTDYYAAELGLGLKRKFIGFERPIPPENIYKLKELTNRLERRFSVDRKRRINIDPGYLCLSKIVLLTTKDYYHRIYLGHGIYAETTLNYQGKAFRPFEWTYPDYKSQDCIGFFNKLRENYAAQLKREKC